MTLAELESIGADLPSMVSTIGGARHQDYTRVCDLRDLYMKLISGKDVNSLLRQFVRREDEELFKQRCALTQAITPEVAAQLMAPFYKVTRVNNITEVIDFPNTEGFQDKKDRVLNARKKYNGDRSLDDYMDTRFIELSFCDPNSFIVTDFYDGERDGNGILVKPVVPYPREVSCVEAVNFCYKNNTLEWLVIYEGSRYLMYLSDWSVTFTKVSAELYNGGVIGSYIEVMSPNGPQVVYKMNENDLYLVESFDHKSKEVPAKRVGYKRDLETDGRTFVPPLHDALASFMKSIKTVSEFDISMALHAHPQKLQQSPRCSGTPDVMCMGGQTPEGKTCGKCGGSGIEPISTTAQDAIVVPMAQTNEEMITLDNLVKYVQLPVDLLEFQYKFTKELKDSAREAMYNTDVFARSTVAATATEKKLSMESVYDVLIPFAKQYSAMWKHNMVIMANYVDAPNIIIEHVFPKDFGFRTRDELISQLNMAAESAAPGYIKKSLSRELAASMFVDKPDEIKRIEIKERLYPFSDKTQAEIALIVNSDMTDQYTKVLWANFDQIFDEIEKELFAKNIYLFDVAEDKIQTMVREKVVAKINNIQKPNLVLDMSGLDESTDDVQTEEQKSLTGLVGFATTIIEIKKSVSLGTDTIDSAAFTLHKLSGWTIEECKQVIGAPKPASDIIDETGGTGIPNVA